MHNNGISMTGWAVKAKARADPAVISVTGWDAKEDAWTDTETTAGVAGVTGTAGTPPGVENVERRG